MLTEADTTAFVSESASGRPDNNTAGFGQVHEVESKDVGEVSVDSETSFDTDTASLPTSEAIISYSPHRKTRPTKIRRSPVFFTLCITPRNPLIYVVKSSILSRRREARFEERLLRSEQDRPKWISKKATTHGAVGSKWENIAIAVAAQANLLT
ncbi:hypothetical protein HO173_010907 [Letharia columbiana]|uniref:Uncharacterized protein n=1 Tax=Letharia columbiana TaxID=112416 RepID=A0A8H6L0B5_9LECA|nr:uncharacterized protein HO173_010907 [Letharia columbiana]KAF6230791.1 hypothetical protein HO173_010907 [Letharia columbiana]